MFGNHTTKFNGSNFDEAAIEAVWRKATPEPGYPSFRKDCRFLFFKSTGADILFLSIHSPLPKGSLWKE